MTTRLKELLEKRRQARANNTETTPEIGVQLESNADTASIIIPEWVLEDEFSEYF